MDSQKNLFLHREARPTIDVDSPWPGTVKSGDPHTLTMNSYASPDGKLLMGVWQSTPGVWDIDYQDWEYCHFLEGRCIITPENGQPVELQAGDVFIVEPGLRGTWEVLETVRKYYVFSLR